MVKAYAKNNSLLDTSPPGCRRTDAKASPHFVASPKEAVTAQERKLLERAVGRRLRPLTDRRRLSGTRVRRPVGRLRFHLHCVCVLDDDANTNGWRRTIIVSVANRSCLPVIDRELATIDARFPLLCERRRRRNGNATSHIQPVSTGRRPRPRVGSGAVRIGPTPFPDRR